MAIDTSIAGFTGFFQAPPQEAPTSAQDFLRGFQRGMIAGAARSEAKKQSEQFFALNQARREAGEAPITGELAPIPGVLPGILGAALGPDLEMQKAQANELLISQARQNAALASRRFAAQQAYQSAVTQDLAKLGPDATEADATKIAARHFLRLGPAMGEGFGSALSSIASTQQRAQRAESQAEYQEGLLKLREESLGFLRDKLKTLSDEKEADRQLKRDIQNQLDARTRDLAQLRAQTAIARASQIPDHMRRDAYKAKIQQLLNQFPGDAEFKQGLQTIMDEFKVKAEPSENPAAVVPGTPPAPIAPTAPPKPNLSDEQILQDARDLIKRDASQSSRVKAWLKAWGITQEP